MSANIQGLGDLDALVRDLGVAPAKADRAIRRVMKRGGQEMKKKMQADFQGSRSFRHVGRSVTYDVVERRGATTIEVGPDAARSSSAPLAGIAYFGGANGGGGTVREPDYILEAEADNAVDWIEKELRGLL